MRHYEFNFDVDMFDEDRMEHVAMVNDLGVEDDIDGDFDYDSPDDDSEMYGTDVEQFPEFDE